MTTGQNIAGGLLAVAAIGILSFVGYKIETGHTTKGDETKPPVVSEEDNGSLSVTYTSKDLPNGSYTITFEDKEVRNLFNRFLVSYQEKTGRELTHDTQARLAMGLDLGYDLKDDGNQDNLGTIVKDEVLLGIQQLNDGIIPEVHMSKPQRAKRDKPNYNQLARVRQEIWNQVNLRDAQSIEDRVNIRKEHYRQRR